LTETQPLTVGYCSEEADMYLSSHLVDNGISFCLLASKLHTVKLHM